MNDSENMLSVRSLTIDYVTRDLGCCHAVRDFDLDIKKGETVGLVGETGAGKTTVALGIMRLISSPPGVIRSGEVIFGGQDIYKLSAADMRSIRGDKISMIFQDPMTALNPIDRIGDQVTEVILLHEDIPRKDASIKACKILEMVGISADRYNEYPHQFSGGMRQRVVIAIALACTPELLIADEPTTALDVTIQAQVLEMMRDLKEKLNTSVLLITHDLGVVAAMCQRVAVMYAGQIVEIGDAAQIFDDARHPYTIGLFNSLPNSVRAGQRLTPINGLMPDPARLPKGCSFGPRCRRCTKKCLTEQQLTEVAPGHFVRCVMAAPGKEQE